MPLFRCIRNIRWYKSAGGRGDKERRPAVMAANVNGINQPAYVEFAGKDEMVFTNIPQIEVSEKAREVKPEAGVKLDVRHVNFYYGPKQALSNVTLPIRERQVTALIRPSGCGKTTFLRTLNRMNDLIPGTRVEGEAIMDGDNIYRTGIDVIRLRQRVGMVFQRPNPFPSSIFDNVAYGLRAQRKSRHSIADTVEQSLRGAALWDEVKDRLKAPAQGLSGGQQQRLCIARALAVKPE